MEKGIDDADRRNDASSIDNERNEEGQDNLCLEEIITIK
jgi:hypothetical protein